MVYIRVTLLYNYVKYPPSQYHAESNNTLRSTYSSLLPPEPPATTDLSNVLIVLSFQNVMWLELHSMWPFHISFFHLVICIYVSSVPFPELVASFFFFFYVLILEERKRERETSVCCSTYWCIHWLLLICALTRDQAHNIGVSGRHS